MRSTPTSHRTRPPAPAASEAVAARSADRLPSAGPSRILLGVFETLDRAGIPYCVLHGYEGYPERIKSDVDGMIAAHVRPDQLAALLHQNRSRIGAEVV